MCGRREMVDVGVPNPNVSWMVVERNENRAWWSRRVRSPYRPVLYNCTHLDIARTSLLCKKNSYIEKCVSQFLENRPCDEHAIHQLLLLMAMLLGHHNFLRFNTPPRDWCTNTSYFIQISIQRCFKFPAKGNLLSVRMITFSIISVHWITSNTFSESNPITGFSVTYTTLLTANLHLIVSHLLICVLTLFEWISSCFQSHQLSK